MVASVLSGNRNFEGRIHPEVKMNYLASPPLCVAYALAGRMDLDIVERAAPGRHLPARHLAHAAGGQRRDRVGDRVGHVPLELRRGLRGRRELERPRHPRGRPLRLGRRVDLRQAPALLRGDARRARPRASTRSRAPARSPCSATASRPTTSRPPARSRRTRPPGAYLIENGVEPREFNSYGSRRGNHEVMIRGTFANIRLRNLLGAGSTEGGWTIREGEQETIYDAAVAYAEEDTPLCVLAGKEYGSGSSRDWAAKGPRLLGIRFVIAESYERIHRSNLVGMGVLPLQFPDGESVESLGLKGDETFDLAPLEDGARELHVTATPAGGGTRSSSTRACASTRRTSGSTTATAGSCTSCCAGCCGGAAADAGGPGVRGVAGRRHRRGSAQPPSQPARLSPGRQRLRLTSDWSINKLAGHGAPAATRTATRSSSDERREQVIDAAVKEFAEHGYHATSTSAIAKRAGISQPYIYALFPNKRELFLATERTSSARSATPSPRPRAVSTTRRRRLHAMGEAYMELLEEPRRDRRPDAVPRRRRATRRCASRCAGSSCGVDRSRRARSAGVSRRACRSSSWPWGCCSTWSRRSTCRTSTCPPTIRTEAVRRAALSFFASK